MMWLLPLIVITSMSFEASSRHVNSFKKSQPKYVISENFEQPNHADLAEQITDTHKLRNSLKAAVEYNTGIPKYWNDLIDAVKYIADKYFVGHCLGFYHSNPMPEIVSTYLPLLHKGTWTLYTPCKNLYYDDMMKTFFTNWGRPASDGLSVYIKCSGVVALNTIGNYTEQITKVLYNDWNGFFVEGGSPNTRFVVVIDGQVSRLEVYQLLKYMFQQGDIDVVIVGVVDDTIKVFSIFPFGRELNRCPENLTLGDLTEMGEWPGNVTQIELFPKKVPLSFNKCSFPVSTMYCPPFMFKDENGAYQGMDYELVSAISKHLNMKLHLVYYPQLYGVHWNDSKGNIYGSLNDARVGNTWAVVTGRPNNNLHYSLMYDKNPFIYSSIYWYFPNPLPVEPWKLVYFSFDYELWSYVALVLLITPLTFYIVGKIRGDSEVDDFWKCAFALWSVFLGNTTGFSPKKGLFIFLFANWLYYSLHINNAYTASLTGMLTRGVMNAKISTIDDVLEKQLPVALNKYDFPVFRTPGYFPEAKYTKAFQRSIIIQNRTQTIGDMVNERNVSLIDNGEVIDHLIKKHKLTIYNSGLKIHSAPLGLMVKRNHYMFERLSQLAGVLGEAGINIKVISEYTKALWTTEDQTEWQPITLLWLEGPIYILFYGFFLSSLAFIGEILYFRFRFSFFKSLN